MSEPRHKELSLRIKSAMGGVPDAGQLAAIRQFTLADFPEDQLVAREFYLAHNAIDRDGEVFDEALLGDFARTIVGKGVHIRHPGAWDGDSGPGEGRVFAASTETMSFDEARKLLNQPSLTWPPDRNQAVLLKTQAYFVRTPDNPALLTKMDAGIAGDVSIGFTAAARAPINDSEGRAIQATRLLGPGEALEQSLVWLGAQQGARAFKHAPHTPTKDSPMTPEEKAAFEASKTRVTELETATAANAKAVADATAVKAALGADSALLDTPAKLVELVAAGKSHRAGLIDSIVAAERVAGTVGDTDDAVNEAKSAYELMPLASLLLLSKRFEGVTATKAGQLGAGDPNAQKPPPVQTGDKSAKGPLDSPLL